MKAAAFPMDGGEDEEESWPETTKEAEMEEVAYGSWVGSWVWVVYS